MIPTEQIEGYETAGRLRAKTEACAAAAEMIKIAAELRGAERFGSDIDEPEGARFIRMSATLADRLAEQIEKFVAGSK